MYAFGLIVSAIAVGHTYSQSAGWLVLGVGFIIAGIFSTLTGKEIE